MFHLIVASLIFVIVAALPVESMSQQPTLDTTPTSATANTLFSLHFVGTGWEPGANLVLGLRQVTSQQVGEVSPDGTFDFTLQYTLTSGAYHPFASTGPSGTSKQTILLIR